MDQFEFWRWPDEQTPLRRAGGPFQHDDEGVVGGTLRHNAADTPTVPAVVVQAPFQILHLAAVELLDLVGVGRRGWIRHLRGERRPEARTAARMATAKNITTPTSFHFIRPP